MYEELIEKVASLYQLEIRMFEVIHHNRRTLVIGIETSQGDYVLKCIYTDEERLRFILEAEQYLRQRGFHIPRVVPDKENRLYFRWNDVPFVLQQWIPGTAYRLATPEAVSGRAALLGKMHHASLGFSCEWSERYRGAAKWEQENESERRTIFEWKNRQLERKTTNPKRVAILEAIDFFLPTADQLLDRLGNSPYFHNLKRSPLSQQHLCHGDFHTGNVITWEGKDYIIDWEFVRYDFPSKDFGRLLFVVMRREGAWNPETFDLLLSSYLQANPLNQQQMALLYLDLAFPHNFERFLRKKWYKEMNADQVNQFLRREYEKTVYLLDRL